MSCGSLDGRGVWGRMDTCICRAESLHCSPETITTLLIGYTPIQNKKFLKNQSFSSTGFGCESNLWEHLGTDVSGSPWSWGSVFPSVQPGVDCDLSLKAAPPSDPVYRLPCYSSLSADVSFKPGCTQVLPSALLHFLTPLQSGSTPHVRF